MVDPRHLGGNVLDLGMSLGDMVRASTSKAKVVGNTEGNWLGTPSQDLW